MLLGVCLIAGQVALQQSLGCFGTQIALGASKPTPRLSGSPFRQGCFWSGPRDWHVWSGLASRRLSPMLLPTVHLPARTVASFLKGSGEPSKWWLLTLQEMAIGRFSRRFTGRRSYRSTASIVKALCHPFSPSSFDGHPFFAVPIFRPSFHGERGSFLWLFEQERSVDTAFLASAGLAFPVGKSARRGCFWRRALKQRLL